MQVVRVRFKNEAIKVYGIVNCNRKSRRLNAFYSQIDLMNKKCFAYEFSHFGIHNPET